jgi:hypothetical protein
MVVSQEWVKEDCQVRVARLPLNSSQAMGQPSVEETWSGMTRLNRPGSRCVTESGSAFSMHDNSVSQEPPPRSPYDPRALAPDDDNRFRQPGLHRADRSPGGHGGATCARATCPYADKPRARRSWLCAVADQVHASNGRPDPRGEDGAPQHDVSSAARGTAIYYPHHPRRLSLLAIGRRERGARLRQPACGRPGMDGKPWSSAKHSQLPAPRPGRGCRPQRGSAVVDPELRPALTREVPFGSPRVRGGSDTPAIGCLERCVRVS